MVADSVTSDIFLLLQEKRRRGTPSMTLVLVGCLSLARVIPPPPNFRESDESKRES
jgi:hypothetical protein